MFGIEVGTGPRSSSQDDMAAVVPRCVKDCGDALLGDAREPVIGGGHAERIDRRLDAAVGAVLEADRHRQP